MRGNITNYLDSTVIDVRGHQTRFGPSLPANAAHNPARRPDLAPIDQHLHTQRDVSNRSVRQEQNRALYRRYSDGSKARASLSGMLRWPRLGSASRDAPVSRRAQSAATSVPSSHLGPARRSIVICRVESAAPTSRLIYAARDGLSPR